MRIVRDPPCRGIAETKLWKTRRVKEERQEWKRICGEED